MASNLNEYCLSNILEDLSENPHDLYTCTRLSRHWSKIAVSILWRNHPWKCTFYPIRFWKKISRTILLSLPGPIKEFLVLNRISKSKIINENSGYNYISYCQLLSQNLIFKLAYGILHRYNYKHNRNYFIQHYLIEELWKLFLNNIRNIDYFILPDDISMIKFYNDIKYDSIFQSLKKLECSTRISPEIFIQLSKFLNDISELIVYVYYNYPNYDNDGLATLISCQNKLESVTFVGYDYEVKKICPNLAKSLESLSDILVSLQFKEEDISSVVICTPLMNLKHLEIDLGNDNVFTDKDLESLKSIELPSLEILEITLLEINSLDSLVSFVQKTNYTLKKIKIDAELITKDYIVISNYINAIISYCPLMEHLNLWVTSNELGDIETLLISCADIKYLQLEAIVDDDDDNIKFIEAEPFLKLFSMRESGKLEEIKLTGKWHFTSEELENFLVESGKQENVGLKIEFHSVNEDKDKFKEICQKFDETGILKKYEFGII